MEWPNAALLCCEIICLEDHIELEAGDKFSSWLPVMKGVLSQLDLFSSMYLLQGNEFVSMLMLTMNKFMPRVKIQ